MNQTENNEQTTQQNKTIWKLAVAAFIFAAMFFGANALAGQNVLLNIVCALVLAGAAVFCGRKISSHHKFTTREVAFIGMMSAIVFVSNYISFTIPLAIGGDITRVHVANAFCLLAGLSLGPVRRLRRLLFRHARRGWTLRSKVLLISKRQTYVVFRASVRAA